MHGVVRGVQTSRDGVLEGDDNSIAIEHKQPRLNTTQPSWAKRGSTTSVRKKSADI